MAAIAKSAAKMKAPVVRFSQNMLGNRLLDARHNLALPAQSGLRLDGGDCDGVDNVARGAASR